MSSTTYSKIFNEIFKIFIHSLVRINTRKYKINNLIYRKSLENYNKIINPFEKVF